jgi:hypothetical protein
LGTLLGILASGAVVDRLSAWALRLLEGYWPRAFTPVRRWAVSRVAARAVELEQRFQAVAGPVDKGTASTEQTEQYVQADRRLRRLPREGSYLPTGVGNVLRAAERRPAGKYGLEAVTVWPHLWLLLPDTVRTELAAARRSLDVAVSACVWAVFFIGFRPWRGGRRSPDRSSQLRHTDSGSGPERRSSGIFSRQPSTFTGGSCMSNCAGRCRRTLAKSG